MADVKPPVGEMSLQAELAMLREQVARLEREKADLELMAEMTTEHSDEVAEEMEDRLRVMELLQQEQAREGWAMLRARRQGKMGYIFEEQRVQVLHAHPQPDAATYLVPMKVQQGQVVGMLGVRNDPAHPLLAEERALLDALAEQVVAALDRVRLFEDTRRSAARDQIISEVSARMRASMDIDTVLQTTIREIGDALNFSRVEVRLGEVLSEGTSEQ